MTSNTQPGNLPKRVLITRLSAHGDVIQTLPLLASLKDNNPDLEIGWLVESAAASLLQNHPLIDTLHICPRKQWLGKLKNPLHWFSVLKEISDFTDSLKHKHYEASFDVQGLLKSALWPWLAKIPRRYGNQQARENASMFYNHTLPPHTFDTNTPAINRYIEFAEAAGFKKTDRTRFPLPPVTQTSQRKIAALLAGNTKPLAVIAPASIWPSKHWVEAHWQSLITTLQAQGYGIAVIGSPWDEALIKRLLSTLQNPDSVINLAGKTNLVDLYALFEQSELMIGLDSAPLHIANAVADNTPTGTPRIVGIFGSTAARRTGAISTRHKNQHASASLSLDCQPCFERHCPLKTHACMVDLKPEAILALLKQESAV